MALQDKIGRKDIVDKICGLVDSLQKDQNFCLSINGAWGSGKSFVLQMIEEQLSKKQEYIIVKYDAWENTFYSDPLIAILSCLIDGIEDKLYLVERSKEKAKKAIKTTAKTLAKFSAKINTLQEIISGIKSVLKSFHNPIDSDTESMGNFKSYQKLLKETKEVLNEITQKGEYDKKQTKLIVLVDEIDRCLPDEQLKILERLHHLLGIKNCAVIVAMNQVCIAQTVKTIYGIDGNEYLRKFFNYSFRLEMLASSYLKSLFDELENNICKVNSNTEDVENAIQISYKCLMYGSKKLLDNIDNREISRYYNNLLAICSEFGWVNLTKPYIFFLLIGLYIRKNVSPSFLNEEDLFLAQKRHVFDDGMPYVDYLQKYLGVNRHKLPDEITMPSLFYRGSVPEICWDFNQIVFFSCDKLVKQTQGIYDQSNIDPAMCQELRRLIMLYGGEQNNATNER